MTPFPISQTLRNLHFPVFWIPAFLAGMAILLALPAHAADRYIDHGDGTVTDTTTGLMWKRCAEGQTWTGATCSGSTTTYTWEQAIALTSTFAGHNDWRVPNIREMQTIVDRTQYKQAIDESIFLNVPWHGIWGDSEFWSASTLAGNSSYAWNVNFSYGFAGYNIKSSTFFIRLVRTGQCFAPFLCNSLNSIERPTTDYVDHGNGTVTHTPSCLMWKRCAEGQTWNGSTCTGSTGTYVWDIATGLTDNFSGYSDWRLPTADELISLTDYSKYSPAINSIIFPNTPSSSFWSALSVIYHPLESWGVDYYYGITGIDGESSANSARLVRAGQCFDFLILGIQKSGTGSGVVNSRPNGVNCGTDCSESFAANTAVTLTATANNGSIFSGWGGACFGTGNTCTVSMNAAKNVTATFNITTYILTVNTTDTGTVSSSPAGINHCSGLCTASFTGGAAVTLTATAASGSRFAGWGGGCSGTENCTVTLNANQSVTASFTAAKSNQTIGAITFNPSSIKVNGTTTVSANATSGLAVVFTTTTPKICTVSGNIVTGKAVGTCTITANQSGNTTYNAAPQVTGNLGVGKLNQSIGAITFNPSAININGTTTVSATASSGLAVIFTTTTPSICTVSGNSVTGIAAGTCTIIANQSGNATYNAAPQVTGNLGVGKLNQSIGAITFNPSAININGTTTVSATASSGLAVTFTSITPSVCTVSGNNVTGIAAGTCTITANQSGNATYNAALQVTGNLAVIAPVSDQYSLFVIPTGTGQGTIYSFGINCGADCEENYAAGTSVTLIASADSGSTFAGWSSGGATLCAGTTAACTITMSKNLAVAATFNRIDDNQDKINQTIGALMFNPGTVNVNGTATASASATSGLTVVFTTTTPKICTVSGNIVTGKAAGICNIAANQPGNEKYNAASQITKTLTVIVPKPDIVMTNITLNPTTPTANGVFNVTVTVKNQGTGAGDAGQLALWIDQPDYQNCGMDADSKAVIGTLAAGASKTLTLNDLLVGNTTGKRTLRVFVDAKCNLVETNEINNQRTKIYTVIPGLRSDLVVTSITITPQTPEANSNFNVKVMIKNQGAIPANSGQVSIWVDAPKPKTCDSVNEDQAADLGMLGEGVSTIMNFTLPAGAAGDKVLRVFLDSKCEVAESNENNNQLTKTYTVY